jgi:Tol biopolymer transport system component
LAYYLLGQGSFLFELRKSWEQQTPQPIGVGGNAESGLGVWDWSPDGKKLACVKFRPGTQQLSVAVYWLATPDSAPHWESVAENGEYPAWLSDSRRLLFTSAGKLYLADLQAKTTREVFAPGQDEAAEYPVLTRDDRKIYFSLSSTEADIWLLKL